MCWYFVILRGCVIDVFHFFRFHLTRNICYEFSIEWQKLKSLYQNAVCCSALWKNVKSQTRVFSGYSFLILIKWPWVRATLKHVLFMKSLHNIGIILLPSLPCHAPAKLKFRVENSFGIVLFHFNWILLKDFCETDEITNYFI